MLVFIRILKVSDEPLGESNTERRVKISAGISNKIPNNIFIVKFKLFTPWVKILGFKSHSKNRDFPKSKNLHESIELKQGGGNLFWRGTNSGGKIFDL